MAGVKVLPEVRIFSDLAQDIAERRIDLPMQSDELFHHRPRGRAATWLSAGSSRSKASAK